MTEIIESNRLIAEFMGGVYGKSAITLEEDRDRIYLGEDEIMYQINARHERYALKYHTSWDWLMSVVEKIKDIDNQATISDAKALELFKKEHEGEGNNIFETSIFCHIGEVFNRVVEFIKWYNQIDK